jgi:TatD DNase family protein
MRREKKLTDIHAHIDQYTPKERELILQRADAAGVRWIVTSGMDLSSSSSAVKIASAHRGVLASVGIHPWVAAENFPLDFHEKLRRLAQEDVTVAIGEVGLDFINNVFTGVTYYDNENLRKAQEQAFRKQVELACELMLPLIVHCREAYSTLISILHEEKAYRIGGVIHNFDGDEKVADQLLDMDFYLSFGGTITYPTASALQEIARHIPIDGILIETDSPYMPLYSQSADKNEPANVVQIVQTLAELKKIDEEELINITYTNFRNLLNITGPVQTRAKL